METTNQTTALLQAWVQLSGILKNSRFTKGLSYNEAIIMLHLYEQWQLDGIGILSVKEIISRTGMLKSLVNRTINSLESKELLERCRQDGDKRIIYVRCVQEKLDIFLTVHSSSMEIAHSIENIIGPEDTAAFIRIVEKISNSGFQQT